MLKGGKSKESTRMEAYKSLQRSGGGYNGVWRIYSIRMSVEGGKSKESTRMEAYKSLPGSGGGYNGSVESVA